MWLAVSSSNTNDKLRVKLYVNHVPLSTTLGRLLINSSGTGNQQTNTFMWYRTCVANEYIAFWITNLTGGRACIITDFKIYIEKAPE